MTEQQNASPQTNNQPFLIVLVVIVVLLIIAVIVMIFWTAGSDQKVTVEPTMTEVALEATASITPEDEPTATITESPTEEATNEPTLEPPLEPTAAPTEEPPAGLPPEPQLISFQAEDGQDLEGRFYPGAASNSALIVLMHWAPGNMDDWNEIAFWLQNRGLGGTSSNVGAAPWLDPTWFPSIPEGKSYSVFTFNFREGSRDKMLLDAQAAFSTVRSLEGVDPSKIASMGASIGGDGAPDGCLWHNENFGIGCLGALSLSPGSYLTLPYADVVEKLGNEMPPKPVWCFFAADDTVSKDACQSASGDHYRMVEWSGSRWHGMELIDPALDPNSLLLVLDWLATLGL
jgi:dienelactone hydrolase